MHVLFGALGGHRAQWWVAHGVECSPNLCTVATRFHRPDFFDKTPVLHPPYLATLLTLRVSNQNLFHDLAMHVGKTEVAALVTVGQPRMIDA